MSGFLSASHWLVVFPCAADGGTAAPLQALRSALAPGGGGAHAGHSGSVGPAEVSELPLSAFKVGTFEALLSLSDDLARADSFAEACVRRAERAVADVAVAAAAAAAAEAGPNARATPAPNQLLGVNGVLVSEYVRRWRWDAEAWDARDPLPELSARLSAACERADAELRSYVSAYTEARTALTAAERRRDGNLLVRALDEVITPAALAAAQAEVVGPALSEYVQTYAVVLPVANEAAFLSSYETLAGDAVPYGPEGRRDASRGSPVVPGSARRLATDREGFVLFLFAALRKYEDALKAAAKERKLALRDFAYAPDAAAAAARALAAQEVATAAALTHLRAQAQRKYGELVALWMHVKAVRLFVAAVLRYGLPAPAPGAAGGLHPPRGAAPTAPYAAAVVACARGKQRAALEAAKAAWAGMGSVDSRAALDDAYGASAQQGAADDPVIAGVNDSSTASLPFVLFDFDLRTDTAAVLGAGR